jgi:hypothetical protein
MHSLSSTGYNNYINQRRKKHMNLNYTELTKKYQSELVKEFEANMDNYINSDGEFANEDTLEETAMDAVLEDLKVDYDGEIIFIEEVLTVIAEKIQEEMPPYFFQVFEEDVRIIAEDNKAYQHMDAYQYNGISQSDFI